MEGFYEEVVPGMTEDQFRANFRLTRTTTAKAMEVTLKPPICGFLRWARAIQATPRRSSVFRIGCGEFRVQDVKFGIGVLVISSCIFVATL